MFVLFPKAHFKPYREAATEGPMPKAKSSVPTPTTPPKHHPTATTVSSMALRTHAMGRFVLLCKPVINPSLGPGPQGKALGGFRNFRVHTNIVHIEVGPGRGTRDRTKSKNHCEIEKISISASSGTNKHVGGKIQRPKRPHWQNISI